MTHLKISVFSACSTYALVEAVEMIEKNSTDNAVDLDYGEALERAFRMGPESTRRSNTAAQTFLNILIVVSQFGRCCVCVLFAADNILVRCLKLTT